MQTQTAPAAPERSHQQRMDALAKGNDIRQRRARFKEQMKHTVRENGNGSNGSAKRRVLACLTDVPDWADTMKVGDLIRAVPKIGQVKVGRLLNICRISPSKTVGGLTERQRAELRAQIAKP